MVTPKRHVLARGYDRWHGCLLKPGGGPDERGGAADFTAIEHGERQAAEQLLPLVYDELRRLAARSWRTSRRGRRSRPRPWCTRRICGWSATTRTASGTAGATSSPRRPRPCGASWSRRARRKARQKRGGGIRRFDLADSPAPDPDEDLLALDDALNRLASEDPVAAKVIELRQFAGLGHEEIAAALGITVYLARQKWTYARAWLGDALGG